MDMPPDLEDILDRLSTDWTALLPLYHGVDRLSGGMGFQRVKGKEYVVRYFQDPVTGKKKMTSLGPRTAETEKLVDAFRAEREEHASRLASLEARIETGCRLAKAHRFARVPADLARHGRSLSIAGMLGEVVAMAGASAVFGYEVAQRCRMDGHAVVPGHPAPIRFVLAAEAEPMDMELVLLSAGVDPGTAAKTRHDGRTSFLSPDGGVLEFFDRSAFEHGRAPDLDVVAVSRDSRPSPILAVDPLFWLEIEERFPCADAGASARADFVSRLPFVKERQGNARREPAGNHDDTNPRPGVSI